MNEGTLEHVLSWKEFPGEVITSLIVMVVVVLISLIIFIKARKVDPSKPSKGVMNLVEMLVEFFEKLVGENMGPAFKNYPGYFMGIAMYILLCFIFGISGLPAPMTALEIPLSLGFIVLIAIHVTAIRDKKLKYFRRFVDPIPFVPIFLPGNIISAFVPMISLAFRLFGNVISSWVLMTLLYELFMNISLNVFGHIGGTPLFSAIPTALVHLYFDVFVGLIQTYVFVMISSFYIAQERTPDEERKRAIPKYRVIPVLDQNHERRM